MLTIQISLTPEQHTYVVFNVKLYLYKYLLQLRAKSTLRYYLFHHRVGVERTYLYDAISGMLNFGEVSDSFLTYPIK